MDYSLKKNEHIHMVILYVVATSGSLSDKKAGVVWVSIAETVCSLQISGNEHNASSIVGSWSLSLHAKWEGEKYWGTNMATSLEIQTTNCPYQ